MTSLSPNPLSLVPQRHETAETLPSSMMAALFYQPGDVRYGETPIPAVEAGEILIEVKTALTCGTDLKCFRRGHPVLLKTFPSPFGHECAGVVAKIGDGVSKFKVGDRVVAANSAPCYECEFCHRGQHNLCENLNLLNGAYAEYLKVPTQIAVHNTYRLPRHVGYAQAAFCEPLAVSLRGIDLSQVTASKRIAIIGLGPIGQLLVKVAKLKGAHVTALARNPLKRQLSQSFGGADQVVDLSQIQDPKAIVNQYSNKGLGFDVVIEAVGLPLTWQLAVDLVARGGLVNFFGGCESGTQVTLDTRRIHYDEITMISLFHHTPVYFKRAFEMISSGVIDPTPLITKTLPLAQLPQALELIESGEAIKVAIQPGFKG